MKAISANDSLHSPGIISAKIDGTDWSATPTLNRANSYQQYSKLGKQATLTKDHDHNEVIAERSAEELLSPAPLIARISRVGAESQEESTKIMNEEIASSQQSADLDVSNQNSQTKVSKASREKRTKIIVSRGHSVSVEKEDSPAAEKP